MLLDFDKIFTSECQQELTSRLSGDTFYGPPKIYGIAQCTQSELNVTSNWTISRERAVKVVIWMDLLICLLFTLSIYRLRFYEELTVADMKNGQFKVSDFSVWLKDIPISKADYDDCPELLQAMLATHIEDIIQNELQCIETMEDEQEF